MIECQLSHRCIPEPDSPQAAPHYLSIGHVGQREKNVMGISQYDPAAKGRPAWNAGKQVGAKRALKVKQIWLIRFFLDREGRMRDRALFDLAIDSKLRAVTSSR